MTDRDVSLGNAVAVGAWVAAFLLMAGGTVVGLATGNGPLTSTCLAWGIFGSAVAGTLTIRECTRKNRQTIAETIRLMAQTQHEDERGVARLQR